VFREAVEHAPDGIQIVSLDGVVLYSNRAVQEIYGFAPEEFRGRHVDELNADPTFASAVILPGLKAQGRWAGEVRVRHQRGHVFPIWLSATVLVNARGAPYALLGIIRDLSERKQAEEALAAYAARLESTSHYKDLFADIIRHDLLTPLSAIKTGVQLQLRLAPEDPGRQALERVLRNVQRLTDIIQSATLYSKLEDAGALEHRELDLGEALRAAVAQFRSQLEEHTMTVVGPPPGCYPAVLTPMVEEVFINLVSNAIKYSPDGTSIELRITAAADAYRIGVADRGLGIAPEEREHLFTRFQRTEKRGVKGVGLGLAIVKRLVELNHGRVWVDDNPGGGSVFTVELPRGRRA
jgi:PAS domain S-box-containing protein